MANNPAMLGIITFGQAASRLGRRAVVDALVKDGMPKKAAMAKAGYQRGPYGTGVETRGDAFFKPMAVYGSQPVGRLSEVADVHPDIETAYPGVGRSLQVEVVPDGEWAARVAAARRSLRLWERDGGTSSAFYDHGNNLIAVRAQMPGESIKGYVDRADGSLVHELQHYAQHQDGLRPPRRHVDAYDYRVDGLEVDARNSAARRKLTPEERAEMPREMTQDVKPEDVRQDWGGGSVRNETARVSAPALSPRIRLEPEEPRTVIRPLTSYEKWQDDQRQNDSFIHDVIDWLPGRPVRNAARSIVYGAARFGEGLLRVAHELSGPLRPFGSDRFAYSGFGKMADAIDSEIERHPYEYDPDDTQIAPIAEGVVNLGLTAWLGGRVAKLGGGSAFGRGLGRAVVPATFGANAKAQALRQMEAEGIDTADPVNQMLANARGAASAALWAVPFGEYRGTPMELAGVSYPQRVGRSAANIFTRSALDDFVGSGTLIAASERAIADAQDRKSWRERMTEQERKEYLREIDQATSPVFDPLSGRRIYGRWDYDDARAGVDQKYEQIVRDRELRELLDRLLKGLDEAASHAVNAGTRSAPFGFAVPAEVKLGSGNGQIGEARITVQQDAKGGDNFGTFKNFLATDDVPESIFGIPVVQDKSQYTEKDLKFFRENPKAAGFYDLGGEEVDGDAPQQAVGAEGTTPRLTEQQQRAIAGGPRRQWAVAYEDKLDVRPEKQQDGSVSWFVYPKERKDGVIDAAGYRRFKGKTDGKWHLHTNTKRMSLDQWLENADAFDADADATVEKILGDFGLDTDKVPDATKDTLWDMAFISGLDDETGIRRVFRDSRSLHATFDKLVSSAQLTREEAFDLALLSELDTYHKGNHRRVMARMNRLADAISESSSPDRTPYRSVGETFGAAVAHGTQGTAEEREFEGFKTRMRNVKTAVEDIISGGDGRPLWREAGGTDGP